MDLPLKLRYNITKEKLTKRMSTIKYFTNFPVIWLNNAAVLLVILLASSLSFVTTVSGEERIGSIDMTNVKSVCGRRLWKDPQGRIVGGMEAKFAHWPWMVGLFIVSESKNIFIVCGATLVNKNWAVTAAHCVVNRTPEEMFLRLGELDIHHTNESLPYKYRKIRTMIMYPGYDVNVKINDIALLSFESVKFEPHIIPICLPRGNNSYEGKTAFATGWGKTSDTSTGTNLLQEIELQVIPIDSCRQQYIQNGYNELLPNTVLCAGLGKTGGGTCLGDSGGPLVIHKDRENRFELIGVTSFGTEDCGPSKIPGVFTRLTSYMKWMKPIISQWQ